MAEQLENVTFTREDRHRYRDKLKTNLRVLEEMLEAGRFETGRSLVGVEMEFYVVDADGTPMNVNAELLDKIESEDFQTELAQFNIEFNLQPHKLVGRVFRQIEEELRTSYDHADRRAEELDAHVVMIGIIPTLQDLHVTVQNLSNNPRFHLLNEQVLEARGEDLVLDIQGDERLALQTSTIAFEAAATSVQLHLQVAPDEFAPTWNAAAAVSAAQVAMGCNSPFFLGRRLLRETRIAVFEQAIDTRTEELAAQGVRPRVWFGDGWTSSPLELFQQNVDYFPALLPLVDDEDPWELLDAGEVPHLPELTLHNGTIWRWNRPVYAVARGKPHLRVENRVLPAGPSLVDTVANAVFYYGLVGALRRADPPISEQMTFETASRNFRAAAHDGIEAELDWPGQGRVAAPELVLETLLPLAEQGLASWDVDPADRDHYLGIIERRARERTNGAAWQIRAADRLLERGLDHDEALVEMTRRYMGHMRANRPVHTWELPATGG